MGQEFDFNFICFGENLSYAFRLYWKDILRESKYHVLSENRIKNNVELKAALADGIVRFFLNMVYDDGSTKRIELDGGDGINIELCPEGLRILLSDNKPVLMRKLSNDITFEL